MFTGIVRERGRVVAIGGGADGVRLVVEAPETAARTALGDSVSVEGVSLTVAELADDAFAVALVPHTLVVTTLGALRPGDPVNLETDVLAKYVERLLRTE